MKIMTLNSYSDNKNAWKTGKSTSLMGINTTAIRSRIRGSEGTLFEEKSYQTERKQSDLCIETFGLSFMVQYLKGFTSTIRTGIQGITRFLISSVFPPQITPKSILDTGLERKSFKNSLFLENGEQRNAHSALSGLEHRNIDPPTKCSAIKCVNENTITQRGLTTALGFVHGAERHSQLSLIKNRIAVAVNVVTHIAARFAHLRVSDLRRKTITNKKDTASKFRSWVDFYFLRSETYGS